MQYKSTNLVGVIILLFLWSKICKKTKNLKDLVFIDLGQKY